MSDSGLPGPRCGRYVDLPGQFSAYPCYLPPHDDDGPCVALEVPRSATMRAEWQSQQIVKDARVGRAEASLSSYSGPVTGAPAPPPGLNPANLVDPVARQTRQFVDLISKFEKGDLKALPEWAQQGMMSSSAMTTLALLWHLCDAEFEAGAVCVTINREFLERLVPPALKTVLVSLQRS